MIGLLPDLTPRDSHSTWYTSSRNPVAQAALLDAYEQRHSQDNGFQNGPSSRRAGQLLIERSALARLRADEQQMDRRRLNVQNFGSTWLKPPGLPKTLHQMREERKEQEEHAEAMRREQMVAELAEAEAAGQDPGDLGADLDADEDADEEEVRDLDDDIPDAEESFGFDGGDDSDDGGGLSGMTSSEDGGDASDDDASDDDERSVRRGPPQPADDEEGRRDDLVAARMRMTDDAYRQAMARGDAGGEDLYGAEEELEAEGRGHMLDEEDIMPPHDGVTLDEDDDDLGMGMDMDADLDDDIPEAGELSGVYEHTDSEADLSSSSRAPSSDEEDDDEGDISFAPRAAPLRAPLSPTRGRGAAGPRSSMDLSGLLSAESSMMDSSMLQSSPNVRAQRR